MKKIIASFIITALIFPFDSFAQNKAGDITGIWLTGGNEPAKIQIYTVGEKFYGKIIWMKNPTQNGNQRLDKNNPDKKNRNNPIVGLIILSGFKFDGDDHWKGGDIYDPESGKTYSSYLYLKHKNTLGVRGYVGISLLGRTEVWTRSD